MGWGGGGGGEGMREQRKKGHLSEGRVDIGVMREGLVKARKWKDAWGVRVG